MQSGSRLKSYVFDVPSGRGAFSVRFTARDDGAALEHAARWLDDNDIEDRRGIRVVGPDGRDVGGGAAPARHDRPEADGALSRRR